MTADPVEYTDARQRHAAAPDQGRGARTRPRGLAMLRIALVSLDAAAVALAWGWALSRPSAPLWTVLPPVAEWFVATLLLTAVTLVVLRAQGLYLSRVCWIKAVERVRLGRASALSGVLALIAGALAGEHLPVDVAALGAGLSFVLLLAARAVYRGWLGSRRRAGQLARPVVVVGANGDARDMCELVRDHPELGLRVSGVIGSVVDYRGANFDVPWLGETEDAVAASRAVGATGALVVATALVAADLNRTVRSLLAAGLHLHLSSGLHGITHRRLRTLPLAHEPLFYIEPRRITRWELATKRFLDVVVGAAVLLASFPVLLVVAVAIKLEDGGPVLFRQVRVGQYGRPLNLLKFRTMVPHAESAVETLRVRNERRDGPLFKLDADPRETRVGRWLRATSIDELPQLVHVLRGEMSLVGPRPALPEEMAAFDDELRRRVMVPPGVSGLWQVEARDNPSFSAYKRFDLFYIENRSLALDLSILLATAGSVLARAVRALRAPRGDNEDAGSLYELRPDPVEERADARTG